MKQVKQAPSGFYHSELFDDIEGKANSSGWLASETVWEAWLVDTISLVSDNFPDAILVGGSGTRNLTNIYRLTYDVDFDTDVSSLREINEKIADMNQRVVGKRNPHQGVVGAITKKPQQSLEAKFYGANKLAALIRWTSLEKFMNLHIMYVDDDPFIYSSSLDLQIACPFKHNLKTRNAPRHYLLYRKAKRATKEVRVEDFLDIPFLYESAGSDASDIIRYCSHKDRKHIVIKGLDLLQSQNFTPEEVSPRLAHVTVGNMNEFIIKIKGILNEIISKINEVN